jgi:hypothetical protein
VTPTTRNRLKLLGIAAVAIAPIVGSYLLYWFWLPGQQTNYGTLISPRSVPEMSVPLVDGTAFSMKQLRGRWALVVVDSGECAKECQEKLWKIRQVRLTQGKEMGRIERVWLIDDDRPPSAELLTEHAGAWAVKALPGPLLSAVEAKGRNPRDHIYLVDPLGYVMMRFPPAAEPRGMMKDLGRLLKYSRTG